MTKSICCQQFQHSRAQCSLLPFTSFRLFSSQLWLKNGARRAPSPLAEPEIRILQFCLFYKLSALNVPIQRVFLGKKTPYLYVIVSNTSRGIQGGKRPQSTPVRGLFKGFQNCPVFSPIRTQNCARFAQFQPKPVSKTRPESLSKWPNTILSEFKWFLPSRIVNFLTFATI